MYCLLYVSFSEFGDTIYVLGDVLIASQIAETLDTSAESCRLSRQSLLSRLFIVCTLVVYTGITVRLSAQQGVYPPLRE